MMKLSELIENLQEELDVHGDHEVVVDDMVEGIERDVRYVTTMTLHNGKHQTVISIS
jgi:hypothetical protein